MAAENAAGKKEPKSRVASTSYVMESGMS